ncbi:hypothetical protein BASA81_001761 [Batrachochytrium salamandrivorans]|nr:hypothetical protein BASA81_001761 [Batrachochytrium salamandrivorans]
MALELQGENPVDDLELDFTPEFSTFRKKDLVAKLEWRDLDYRVGKKHIIKTVSGEASPGEVVAIMGPSGGGKTTLLNILAGRIQLGGSKKLLGSITMNGALVKPVSFRKRVAYVTQDDSMFPTATVREALEFSCRLRLPASTSKSDRDRIVNDIVLSLGLTKCEHTVIGSESLRGVSGGEKKRCAIGVELVSNPTLLFLDEPTSGLDSWSSLNVVKILKAIAQTGCTVLCSIHQPSSEVFHQFDSLVLLGAGTVVYQGPVKKVETPFSKMGITFPSGVNVADFILLLVQTKPLDQLPNNSKNENRAERPNWFDPTTKPESKVAPVAKSQSTSFRNLFGLGKSFGENEEDEEQVEPRHGLLYQAYWLMIREFRAIGRDKAELLGRYGATAVLNALFAILFQGVGDQSNSNYMVQSHFGALVNIVVTVMYDAAQPALLTFPLERVVFMKERATGTYGTVPYVFSKLLVELPLLFLVALETMLINYWAVGFSGNFFLIVLALWGLMLASVSLALVLGSLAPSPKAAMDWATLLLLPQLLFLGLFVRLDQLPFWLQWPQYLCSAKYALNLAMVVEFDPALAINDRIRTEWAQLLSSNQVVIADDWKYGLVLIALFAGLRLIGVLFLECRVKRK